MFVAMNGRGPLRELAFRVASDPLVLHPGRPATTGGTLKQGVPEVAEAADHDRAAYGCSRQFERPCDGLRYDPFQGALAQFAEQQA